VELEYIQLKQEWIRSPKFQTPYTSGVDTHDVLFQLMTTLHSVLRLVRQ